MGKSYRHNSIHKPKAHGKTFTKNNKPWKKKLKPWDKAQLPSITSMDITQENFDP